MLQFALVRMVLGSVLFFIWLFTSTELQHLLGDVAPQDHNDFTRSGVFITDPSQRVKGLKRLNEKATALWLLKV